MFYLNTTTWEFGGFFFHQDWNSHVSVELAQRLVFPSFENERKQVKSSLSAVQPTEILGYDSST